jgi:hypothetical protein
VKLVIEYDPWKECAKAFDTSEALKCLGVPHELKEVINGRPSVSVSYSIDSRGCSPAEVEAAISAYLTRKGE